MTNLDQKVRELRALAEKATPGRWQNGIEDLEGVVAPENPGLGNVICIPPKQNMYSSLECWPDNAAYIATANPATLTAILDEFDRRGEELARRSVSDARAILAALKRTEATTPPEGEG